jgi:hypothetical protein
MPDFLTTPFANGPHIAPQEVVVRLLLALLLGCIIASVYRFTRRNGAIGASFPATLVLLCILIAMVTQVIGDNVARAFSLVGALSIVRFRTVVRDTQDTAYVIFAVIVGMAVGAKSLWVAAIGIAVVALAEFVFFARARRVGKPQPEFVLKLRIGLDQNLDALLGKLLDGFVDERELLSVGTSKTGESLDASYRVRPRVDCPAEQLVRRMNAHAGVQSVQLARRGFESD